MKRKMILVKVNDRISDGRYWYKKHQGEKIWVFEDPEYKDDYISADGCAILKTDCEYISSTIKC